MGQPRLQVMEARQKKVAILYCIELGYEAAIKYH
jgi:hypothetical protein